MLTKSSSGEKRKEEGGGAINQRVFIFCFVFLSVLKKFSERACGGAHAQRGQRVLGRGLGGDSGVVEGLGTLDGDALSGSDGGR